MWSGQSQSVLPGRTLIKKPIVLTEIQNEKVMNPTNEFNLGRFSSQPFLLYFDADSNATSVTQIGDKKTDEEGMDLDRLYSPDWKFHFSRPDARRDR